MVPRLSHTAEWAYKQQYANLDTQNYVLGATCLLTNAFIWSLTLRIQNMNLFSSAYEIV